MDAAGCMRATSAEPAPWIDEDDRLQRTVSERLGSIKYSRVSDLVTCCLFARPFFLSILMLSPCYSTCLVLTANLRAQRTLALQEQGESMWMFCVSCTAHFAAVSPAQKDTYRSFIADYCHGWICMACARFLSMGMAIAK